MDFNDVLKKYKKEIDNEIDLFFQNKKNPIYKPLQLFLQGGKRLRPILLIMAYKAITGKIDKDIIKASICVELYHASTLIHDDIMDEDPIRRGKETIFETMRKRFLSKSKDQQYNGLLFKNKSTRYAISTGLIAGNLIDVIHAEPLLNSNFDDKKIRKTLKIMTECAEQVNLGQLKDTYLESKKEVTEKEYYDMIMKKTGQLFVSSIQIGAVLGGASEIQYNSLTNYAWNAATTFQLQDDILDTSDKKGHEIGSDIKQGKMTLLVIKSLENGNKIKKYLGKNNLTHGEIKDAISILSDTGAIDYVKNLANKKIKEGKTFLNNANFKEKQFFLDYADFMFNREL